MVYYLHYEIHDYHSNVAKDSTPLGRWALSINKYWSDASKEEALTKRRQLCTYFRTHRGADKSLARVDNSCVKFKTYKLPFIPLKVIDSLQQAYTGCPTTYQTRQFFNNFTTETFRHNFTTDTFLFISHTTNVLLFKYRCNIFIGFGIIKELPGLVGSGTSYINEYWRGALVEWHWQEKTEV